jgi:hypothetical protein
MVVFRDAATSSLVDIDRRFKGPYYFRHPTLILNAVNSSEMPLNICHITRCYIPEFSRLHTRECVNLTSRLVTGNLREYKSEMFQETRMIQLLE